MLFPMYVVASEKLLGVHRCALSLMLPTSPKSYLEVQQLFPE